MRIPDYDVVRVETGIQVKGLLLGAIFVETNYKTATWISKRDGSHDDNVPWRENKNWRDIDKKGLLI